MLRLLVLAASLFAATAWARPAPDFVLEQNPFVLGQAVDWLDQDHVVWHDSFVRDEDDDGEFNIYRSRLDGSEKVCLTCSLDGTRDQVPVVRPGGDWILFHSWHGHTITIGAPGFGGIGSDVWVMTRDGTRHTNLTKSGDFQDHFHAYWSPDGRWIVWTALSWNEAEGGNGRSEVRVGRFDPNGPDGPRLVDVHAVRPPNGHWYETQWWAPDGSGFLYTETADTAINPELFFCRLPDRAHGDCKPVRLTVDPAWDEQAIFTPDMKRIVFMSSRNLPGAHNDWSRVAQLLQLPPDFDYALILSVFSNDFLQPVFQQPTDLYEMTLRWNASHTRFKPGDVRRLTHSGDQGWIIPEFAWDPKGKRLLWSQAKFPDGVRLDQSCVIRRIREAFLARVSNVNGIADIPFDIDVQMRDAASELLRDPRTYPAGDGACGSGVQPQGGAFVQETWIGRYEN